MRVEILMKRLAETARAVDNSSASGTGNTVQTVEQRYNPSTSCDFKNTHTRPKIKKQKNRSLADCVFESDDSVSTKE